MTGNTDNQERRRRKGIGLNSVVSDILISFLRYR
jgi:hypothetical protein